MKRQFERSSCQSPELSWDNLRTLERVQPFVEETQKIHQSRISRQRGKKLKPEERETFNRYMLIQADETERIAYAFTFAHMFHTSDKKILHPGMRINEKMNTTKLCKNPIRYASVKIYGVSFPDAELSDDEIVNDYFRVFLDREEIDLTYSFEDMNWTSIPSSYTNTDSDRRLNYPEFRYLERVLDQVMEKFLQQRNNYNNKTLLLHNVSDIVREAYTEGRSPVEGDSQIWDSGVGERYIIALGLGDNDMVSSTSKDDFNWFNSSRILALGDRVFTKLNMRKTVKTIQKLLKDGNEHFLQLVLEHGYTVQMNDIEGNTLKPEIRAAVEMYAVLARAVTSAVCAGMQRFVLVDIKDALYVELDDEFKLEQVTHGNENLAALLKCRYKWFSRYDEFYFLFFSSFMLPTDRYAEKLLKFRTRAQEALEIEADKLMARNLPVKKEIEPALSPTAFRKFAFHEDAFDHRCYVKVADALQKIVSISFRGKSQVALVNPVQFLETVPDRFIFEDVSKIDSAILKVSGFNRDNFHYDAEKKSKLCLEDIRRCIHEVKMYERFSPLMGDLIPKVYSYGFIMDVSVKVGQVYFPFTGPYILMEHIDIDHTCHRYVSSEIKETKIIPAFKRLHEQGVVFEECQSQNVVVTPEGDVKMMGFDTAYFSKEEKRFEEDINKASNRSFYYSKDERK